MEVDPNQIYLSRGRGERRRKRGSSATDAARCGEARGSRDHRAGRGHRGTPPHASGHACTVRSSSRKGARLDRDHHRQEQQQNRAQLHRDDSL